LTHEDLDSLLAEQVAYYRARAHEYDAGALDLPGGEELEAAVEEFQFTGDVLELACGPGTWTPRLLRHADTLTAVDSSPEMLAIAAKRVGDDDRVRFLRADIFEWLPDRRYDAVFFGFWLSHVPLDRFRAFWATVGECLTPTGRVLFVDDAYRTFDELIEGESDTVQRRLEDGTPFRAVKVPHTAAGLEERLTKLGWEIAVHQTAGPFFWGSGGRASRT
jgi:demethylmenaquinone methyltransferase/2-methoxy-6-polyprenyl-1,4-benzoquinol methylase